MDIHDLTAAYALHALDEVEREEFEAHLAQCERCREELALLTESASALAWAVESPQPPASLRERILAEAGAGRDNVVPLVPRSRRVWPAISAVAACLAIGLGIWAATLRTQHGVSVTAARTVDIRGGNGYVALTNRGTGVVVLKVAAAPAGKTYEAWVIPPGGKPERAGTFHGGGDGMTMVPLDRRVPVGSIIAMTIERAGGVNAPTEQPLMTAQA